VAQTPKKNQNATLPFTILPLANRQIGTGFAIAPLKRRNKFRDLVIFFVDVGSDVGSNSW
jgi:hypothetical protein